MASTLFLREDTTEWILLGYAIFNVINVLIGVIQIVGHLFQFFQDSTPEGISVDIIEDNHEETQEKEEDNGDEGQSSKSTTTQIDDEDAEDLVKENFSRSNTTTSEEEELLQEEDERNHKQEEGESSSMEKLQWDQKQLDKKSLEDDVVSYPSIDLDLPNNNTTTKIIDDNVPVQEDFCPSHSTTSEEVEKPAQYPLSEPISLPVEKSSMVVASKDLQSLDAVKHQFDDNEKSCGEDKKPDDECILFEKQLSKKLDNINTTISPISSNSQETPVSSDEETVPKQRAFLPFGQVTVDLEEFKIFPIKREEDNQVAPTISENVVPSKEEHPLMFYIQVEEDKEDEIEAKFPTKETSRIHRAPKGGITIDDKFYKGGQFIPKTEVVVRDEPSYTSNYNPTVSQSSSSKSESSASSTSSTKQSNSYSNRAPKGGVTIDGKHYKGGQFIPKK